MRHGEPPDLSTFDDVDKTMVGQRTHAEPAEARERLFVIERLRQERSGLGNERGSALRFLGRRPRGLLFGEEQRVLEGDRRLRGEELQGSEPLGGECAGEEVVLEVEQADHLGLPQDG